MLQATQIKWSEAHNKWDNFKLGDLYTQYLFDTYGVTVEAGGRVIWDHVLNVIQIGIEIPIGGAGLDMLPSGLKKKKEKKKIKLIFIMGEVRKDETKQVNDTVSAKLVSDIQNKIEDQLQTKISLSDVQIIKG
jgi:hypothetical protein